jgi:hypothetical protein
LNRLFLILALVIGIGVFNDAEAQSGGRRKEHRNQRRGSMHLFRGKSMGNADKFAKGAGRKGIMARLFKKDRPAWVYHPTNPGKKQRKESRYLFSRYRTKGKKYRSGILAKQNSERARNRSRGNSSFHKSRYN